MILSPIFYKFSKHLLHLLHLQRAVYQTLEEEQMGADGADVFTMKSCPFFEVSTHS